jgi:hypothetical protein
LEASWLGRAWRGRARQVWPSAAKLRRQGIRRVSCLVHARRQAPRSAACGSRLAVRPVQKRLHMRNPDQGRYWPHGTGRAHRGAGEDGPARAARVPGPEYRQPRGIVLSSSDLASLANMSQDLTGPHAPYMLIVHVLVDKIKSGELKPGDRMPSVTELVETYNVSHSTARRALAKLKEMGMTDTVPGYATFVRFSDQGASS